MRMMVSYFDELKMLCRCKREREKETKKALYNNFCYNIFQCECKIFCLNVKFFRLV